MAAKKKKPTKLTQAHLEQQVEATLDEARSKLQALADRYHAEVLLPFCRRHRLTYLAGMGRTVFFDKRGEPVSSLEIPALVPIEAVLDIEGVGRNDCLGFYVADITEYDIRKQGA